MERFPLLREFVVRGSTVFYVFVLHMRSLPKKTYLHIAYVHSQCGNVFYGFCYGLLFVRLTISSIRCILSTILIILMLFIRSMGKSLRRYTIL